MSTGGGVNGYNWRVSITVSFTVFLMFRKRHPGFTSLESWFRENCFFTPGIIPINVDASGFSLLQ